MKLALEVRPSGTGDEAATSNSPDHPQVTDGIQFGDYELLEEIGRGGMGVVFKARQRSLGRIVAIKMILSGTFATREFIQRFRAEAAAAAALQHPNIVAIHEVGVHQGQHFFSMDYIEGCNLAQLIRDGPLPGRRAAQYLKSVAEAVHYAHEQGILHRDLKPANVLIDAHDQPRVMDFGLAKRFTNNTATEIISFGPKMTLTGQMLGSPSYMPPEQATTNRGQAGPFSDVYALGAMLYQLVTGRPPFHGETPFDTIRMALETELIAPRLLNPNVPLDLETICLKCLAKEPPHRYATARELAKDLERFLGGQPIVARPISGAAKLWRWCRRRPAVAGLSAVVGLLLMVLAASSCLVAFRLKQKEANAREALRSSYLAQARLRLGSGQVGQRFRTLETLAQVAAIRLSVELRSEAITAMALPDLREVSRLACLTGVAVKFDGTLGRYAQLDFLGSNHYVSVYRAADRRELARVPLTRTDITINPSPCGRFLAIGFAQTDTRASCQVWEVASGEMVFETTVPMRGFSADFDLQGHVAFGQLDGRVLLYDLNQHRPLAWFAAGIPATGLRFSPDSHYLAVTRFSGHEVLLLDLRQDGAVVARLEMPGKVFDSMDWNDDGTRLAVSCQQEDGSGLVQIWAWEEGLAWKSHLLRGHKDAVTELRFMPNNGFLVTISYDGTTRFWSADTGEQVLATPLKLAMSYVLTNQVALRASPESLSIQEFAADREFRTFPSQPVDGLFRGMDLSPDGGLLAIPGPDGVRLWHVPTRALVTRIPGAPLAVAFHPGDGSLVVAENDRVVRWPVARSVSSDSLSLGAPQILMTSGPRSSKFLIAFSRDGTKLACADGTRAEVLDWHNPAQRMALDHEALLDHVALNTNGTLAVTSGGGFKVWDLRRGEVVFQLARLGQSYSSFSPDDHWLVLSSLPSGGVGGGMHNIFQVGTWQLVKEVVMDHGPWPVSDFTPDGRLLAVRVTPSAIRLFDTRSWSELATIEAPTQDPFSWFTFSRDGTQLAVACDNHLAQLWDLPAIRQALAAIGLDWDLPPYPASQPGLLPSPRVTVLGQPAQRNSAP